MTRSIVEAADKYRDKALKRAGLDVLERHASAIRELRRRTASDIIKIGKHLTAARKICGHGNWQPWLEREFGWTDDTALNFMRIYKLFEADPERVRDLSLPLRSLYLLARPSTPEAVRQEVFGRAERGELPSHAQIKAAVEEARPKSANGGMTPAAESKRYLDWFATACREYLPHVTVERHREEARRIVAELTSSRAK